MDLILELLSKASSLSYEIVQMMKQVNNRKDLDFIDGADDGKEIEEFNLTRVSDIALFNKRREFMQISNKIMGLIMDLSKEEKIKLKTEIERMIEKQRELYNEKHSSYLKIIDLITDNNFSFEGSEEYKQMLVVLKEQFKRHQANVEYLSNIS